MTRFYFEMDNYFPNHVQANNEYKLYLRIFKHIWALRTPDIPLFLKLFFPPNQQLIPHFWRRGIAFKYWQHLLVYPEKSTLIHLNLIILQVDMSCMHAFTTFISPDVFLLSYFVGLKYVRGLVALYHLGVFTISRLSYILLIRGQDQNLNFFSGQILENTFEHLRGEKKTRSYIKNNKIRNLLIFI